MHQSSLSFYVLLLQVIEQTVFFGSNDAKAHFNSTKLVFHFDCFINKQTFYYQMQRPRLFTLISATKG